MSFRLCLPKKGFYTDGAKPAGQAKSFQRVFNQMPSILKRPKKQFYLHIPQYQLISVISNISDYIRRYYVILDDTEYTAEAITALFPNLILKIK